MATVQQVARSPQAATIQPLAPEDEKKVRFIIGKTAFEPLAAANMKVTLNPFVIAIYLGLASALVQYLDYWPKPVERGWIDWIRPLPVFAAMILPIAFFIDFIQRDAFEARAQALLRAPDVRALGTHYAGPGAGLWILRLGAGFIGLVALDGARVRHLYVDEPFRRAGAQADLLAYALGRAFAQPGTDEVRIAVDPLRPYVRDGARAAGFRYVEDGAERVGLLGWRVQEWAISRAEWARAQQAS